MEKNNFNKAYMYIVGIFAIGIAISNIISFFHGVGFALIGSSLLLFLAIANILKSENKKRFGDLFILITLEFIMFIVLFFAYDFNLNGITNKFPLVMRNICAIYSILALAYVIFRYVSEIKGKKYNFVEYMLGNYTPAPKEKKVKPSKAEVRKNKELENGTLEPKPSSTNNVATEIGKTETSTDESVEVEDGEETAEDTQTSEDTETPQISENENQSSDSETTTNHTNYWN